MSKRTGNPEGRPPKFKSEKQLQAKIDEYFTNCPDTRTLTAFDKNSGEFVTYQLSTPTITGLALFLGFCDRRSFYEYEQKAEFTHAIKKARLKIENEYEKQLPNPNNSGIIFALKNLGWKDRTEQEIVNKNGLNITVVDERHKQMLEDL